MSKKQPQSERIRLDVPTELSETEYSEQLEQIRNDFTKEELCLELLDAARHDDVDVVRGILSIHPNILYYRNDDGNTALHMAAANGHANVVNLLLYVEQQQKQSTPSTEHQSSLVTIPNKAGNTPLHWAARNGQTDVVQRLVVLPDVDVLVKNEAGRSILTEGFSCDKHEMVQLLLEHESASEDKLCAINTTNNNNSTTSVVHKFQFGSNKIQRSIRELAMAETSILGQDDPSNDTTGYAIWASSLIAAQWMVSFDQQEFRNTTVLELGAGCGVPGLTLTCCCKHVYLTDFNETVVANLQHNIQLNDKVSNATAHSMNWNKPESWPIQQVDVVIGSDLVYEMCMANSLLNVLKKLRPRRFLYVASSQRQGHTLFISDLQQDFDCHERPAPDAFRSNPLINQDDEECFVHFHELQSMDFTLYDFRRRLSSTTAPGE